MSTFNPFNDDDDDDELDLSFHNSITVDKPDSEPDSEPDYTFNDSITVDPIEEEKDYTFNDSLSIDKEEEEEPGFIDKAIDKVKDVFKSPNDSPDAVIAQQARNEARASTTKLHEEGEKVSKQIGILDFTYGGNIDLDKRKVLREGDTIKTENSITIETEDGKQAIIPTVVDGKQLSEEDAVKHAIKTQEHLGIYDTVEEADEAAAGISERQGLKYGGGATAGAKRWTVDAILADDPNAPEIDLTAKDVGLKTMEGFADLYSGMNWVLKKAGEKTGWKGLEEEGLKGIIEGQDAKNFWASMLSEDAQRANKVELSGDSAAETIHNIINNKSVTVLDVAASAPGTMAGMLAGGAATKIFKLVPGLNGAIAESLGFGMGEGAVAAPSSGMQTFEKIMKLPDEVIEKSPEYQIALKATKGDKDKAKLLIAKAAEGDAAAMTFLTTSALGAPAGSFIAKFLKTGAFTKGGGMSIAAGTIGEGAQEWAQSGEEQKNVNRAVKENADPTQDLEEGVAEARSRGLAAGMAMGGTMATGGQIYQAYGSLKQKEVREIKIAEDLPDSGAEFVTPEEEARWSTNIFIDKEFSSLYCLHNFWIKSRY